jgi:hypothetical protein
MEQTTFAATAKLGDAGIPVELNITVWYTTSLDGVVTVHDSEDDGGPDNPPTWWPEKIKELIEEHFENNTVNFL